LEFDGFCVIPERLTVAAERRQGVSPDFIGPGVVWILFDGFCAGADRVGILPRLKGIGSLFEPGIVRSFRPGRRETGEQKGQRKTDEENF